MSLVGFRLNCGISWAMERSIPRELRDHEIQLSVSGQGVMGLEEEGLEQ